MSYSRGCSQLKARQATWEGIFLGLEGRCTGSATASLARDERQGAPFAFHCFFGRDALAVVLDGFVIGCGRTNGLLGTLPASVNLLAERMHDTSKARPGASAVGQDGAEAPHEVVESGELVDDTRRLRLHGIRAPLATRKGVEGRRHLETE